MLRATSLAIVLYGLCTGCKSSEGDRCYEGDSHACPAAGPSALQKQVLMGHQEGMEDAMLDLDVTKKLVVKCRCQRLPGDDHDDGLKYGQCVAKDGRSYYLLAEVGPIDDIPPDASVQITLEAVPNDQDHEPLPDEESLPWVEQGQVPYRVLAVKVQEQESGLLQLQEAVAAGDTGNSPCERFLTPPAFGFMTGPWTGKCNRDPQPNPSCAITHVAKISDQEFIAGYQDGRYFKMAKFNSVGSILGTARYSGGAAPTNTKSMVDRYSKNSRKAGRRGDKYVFIKGKNFNCNGKAPPVPPLSNLNKDCWDACHKKQGPCIWCGSQGMCCRFGWRDKRNGCDGTFGSPGSGHVCAASATPTTSTIPVTPTPTPQAPTPQPALHEATAVEEICPAQLYTSKFLCDDGSPLEAGQCCPDNNFCPTGCTSARKKSRNGVWSCSCQGCAKQRRLELSDSEAFTKAHNYLRCLHGYPEVAWDAEVAANANRPADQSCAASRLIHSKSYNMDPKAGENLAQGQSSPEAATAAWYNEIIDPGYTPGTWGKGASGAGHYTALIWKATQKLGCASCGAGVSKVWACQYADAAPNSGKQYAYEQNVPQSKVLDATPQTCCSKIYGDASRRTKETTSTTTTVGPAKTSTTSTTTRNDKFVSVWGKFCPSGTVAITSETDCRKAAPQLGRPFAYSGSWRNSPPGCVRGCKDKIYFNWNQGSYFYKHLVCKVVTKCGADAPAHCSGCTTVGGAVCEVCNAGYALVSGVCKMTCTAYSCPKGQVPKLGVRALTEPDAKKCCDSLMIGSSLHCPAGYRSIVNAAECKAQAALQGYSVRELKSHAFPVGCSLYLSAKVYFNNPCGSGKSSWKTKQICQPSSSPSPPSERPIGNPTGRRFVATEPFKVSRFWGRTKTDIASGDAGVIFEVYSSCGWRVIFDKDKRTRYSVSGSMLKKCKLSPTTTTTTVLTCSTHECGAGWKLKAKYAEGAPSQTKCCDELQLQLGGKGAKSCPSGSQPIKTQERCKVVAKTLGKPFKKALHWDAMPRGCLSWASRAVYFNTASGTGHKSAEPICE